ncbi:Gamma-glutamylcyclotransferase [Candidatus Bealeia paramacronuclearis]|uniref:Gamma-glutamylcyclotransferase n=1 Tax=Candidatus Bealeia paramacronuclearis TaxID=1921001 RepID=A0ABZ2C3W7_9PROT|nr:Gamma-glutamylcyclotransferase [Candidatus Bealeia paramacronuclearis]
MSSTESSKVYLFSYGTLRDKSVQIATFSRVLKGVPDKLQSYHLLDLQITDPHVIQVSGKAVHQILQPSKNPEDFVEGLVFELTPQELINADDYEVADYKRIKVQLASGQMAWVYVSIDHP